MNARAARKLRQIARFSGKPKCPLMRAYKAMSARDRGKLLRVSPLRGAAALDHTRTLLRADRLPRPLHRMIQADWLEGKRRKKGTRR